MSKMSKKNKLNKKTRKNYKIESLEPRLLMDASSDESLRAWTEELATVTASNLQNSQKEGWSSIIVDGLLRANENGDMERVDMKGLADLDKVYDWQNKEKDTVAEHLLSLNADEDSSNDVDAKLITNLGADSFADANDVLKLVRNDIFSTMTSLAKKGKITASSLADALPNEPKKISRSNDIFNVTCQYDVSYKDGKVLVDANATIGLDPWLTSWTPEVLELFSSITGNSESRDFLERIQTVNNSYSADISGTNLGIEAEFKFVNFTKKLEFSFALDGKADNGVDLNTMATLNSEFNEDNSKNAKFGVLGLKADGDDKTDLTLVTRLTANNGAQPEVKNGVVADFTFKVLDVDSSFSGDEALKKEFSFKKYDAFNDKAGDWYITEGKTTQKTSKISDYQKFSMGKVMANIQAVSARLNAIQNGDYHDNKVDFDGFLSKNAHSLMNLSAMLEQIINEPPTTLQELVVKLNDNEYNTTNVNNKVNGTKDKPNSKILIKDNCIYIPFALTYFETNSEGKVSTDITSDVYLSSTHLSELLCAEVLENKSVTLQSSATLEFSLVIPFAVAEKAKADSKLYELSLDKDNDKMATIIGSKALVANEMLPNYGSYSNLKDYANGVKNNFANHYSYAADLGIGCCTDASNYSYALYINAGSSISSLKEAGDDDVANEVTKFDPSNMIEFNGVSPSQGFVVKWVDSYAKVKYTNLEDNYTKGKSGRTVRNVSDASTGLSNALRAASELNVLFSHSKNESVKNARVVGFEDCIIILTEANLAGDELKAFCDDLQKNLTIEDADSKTTAGDLNVKAFVAVENAKEVWISNVLPPAQYKENAKLTVTMANESHDLELPAGYFNSAASVSEIAAALQEMINQKFRWCVEDEARGIAYKEPKLFVETFRDEGSVLSRIRFVSLEDFSIDFHNEEFAQWFGYEVFAQTRDGNDELHVLASTTADYVNRSIMDTRAAGIKFHKTFVNASEVGDSFEMTVSVGGETKTIKFNQKDIANVKWASDAAALIQSKLDGVFGWDSNRELVVTSYNDCVCFCSNADYTVTLSNAKVAEWLGFNDYSSDLSGKSSKVWISELRELYTDEISIEKYKAVLDMEDDLGNVMISFGDSEKLTLALDKAELGKLDSLYAVATYWQNLINDAVKANDMDVGVLVRSMADGRLCIRSQVDFAISFTSVVESDLLALTMYINKSGVCAAVNHNANAELSIISEFTDEVKTDCMEVTAKVGGKASTVLIDLSALLDDAELEDGKLSNCIIGAILDRIVSILNEHLGDNYFVVDGESIVANSAVKKNQLIDSIKDINGYSIAYWLGLSGKYGTDLESERSSFGVNATLVDDYIKDDSKVPLYYDFKLTMTNNVTEGHVVVPLRYGVFGETIDIDLTGASCTTTVANEDSKIRLRNLDVPSYNYAQFNNNWWQANLNSGINGNLYAGGIAAWSGGNTFETQSKFEGLLNTENSPFRTFGMGDLYEFFEKAVYPRWINQFFGESATGLKNINLPVYGKTILEVMGLRAKLDEFKSLVASDRSCANVQELASFLTKNTGMIVTPTFNNQTLSFDIEWNTKITNKLVELDSLYFNREDFVLSGFFKTFLTSDLTFRSHFELEADVAKGLVIPKINVEDTEIVGFVSISAKNISADMDVNLYETDKDGNTVLKQTTLQVESQTKKSSDVFLKASVLGQEVQMQLGGTLHAYRYGAYLGAVGIKVAHGDKLSSANAWNGVSKNEGNGESDNGGGVFRCVNATAQSAVALKDPKTSEVSTIGSLAEGTMVLDLSGIKDLELKQTHLYDRLRQSVDGLSNTVRRIQSSLNSALVSRGMRDIPLVGDSIVGVGDSLSFLETDFIEPLRRYVYKKTEGMTAAMVAEKLYNLLHEYIPTGTETSLDICSDDNVAWWAQKQFNRYYKGIQFFESDQEAYWHIRLNISYTLDENGDFNIGYPGLGLKGEGGVNLSLLASLDIGFGISLKDGAFLMLSNGYEKLDDKGNVVVDENLTKQVAGETPEKAHSGDDVTVTLMVTPKGEIKGSLGFLAMSAKLEEKTQSLSLGLDLNDGDGNNKDALEDFDNDKGAKSVIHFNELRSSISPEVNLRGSLDLTVPMTLGIGGYAQTAPHIDTTFNLAWASSFGDGFGSLEKVGFGPIVFDCGSFVKNTVGDLIEKVNKVIKPVQPLIKFLQSEIPVLNKLPAGKVHMTVLDLVKKFGESKGMDFGFLDDIIEMNNVVKKMDQYVNKGIMLTEWTIYDKLSDGNGSAESAPAAQMKPSDGMGTAFANSAEDIARAVESKVAESTTKGMDVLYGRIANVEEFVNNEFDKYWKLGESFVDRIGGWKDVISEKSAMFNDYVDYAKNVVSDSVSALQNQWSTTGESTSSSSMQVPEFGGSWLFPILENPKAEIMKMMMGGHADLVIFDMNPLKFNFDWKKSFPIIGPLCADVGFSFGVDIDLCFGYDTFGAERWAQSGFRNVGALIDGFYVGDWDPVSHEDISEIVFHSGVVAGASICGRFGVNVGLNLNVDLDLKDPNGDGKVRLTEMAEMLSFNPLDTFDVSATISARAYAYLDLYFYSKEWTLWSSGAFDLFKTASKSGDSVATHSGEDLVVSVGEFAKNRNVKGDMEDGAESVTIDVKDSSKVAISITTDKGKSYSNSYKVDKGGNLCVYAGEGQDKIVIKGDKKADFNIIVYGGTDNDNIDLSGLSLAENRYAIVMGGSGNDILKGAMSGTNYLFGEEGLVTYTPATSKEDKKIYQTAAYIAEDGTSGTDVIVGGENTDDKTRLRTVIFGGDGDDFIAAGSDESYLFGDYGRLTENADGSIVADRHDMFDEGGDDLIYGNKGEDHVYSGAGNDLVNAHGGNDEIYGGLGNDVIYGGSGDDAIYGGDGTDVIFGDAPHANFKTIARSDDSLENGAQLPYTFVAHDLKGMRDAEGKYLSPFFSTDGEVDSINLFNFNEKFVEKNAFVAGMDDEMPDILQDTTEKGSDVIDGGNGADVIFGDDGMNAADIKRAQLSGGNDKITGGAGNDFIDGDAGDDTIDAGGGVDIVYGGRGSDTLDGGADNDFVFGDDGLRDYASFGTGTWFNSSNEIVFGETISAVNEVFKITDNASARTGGGNDTIIAGNGTDFVDGQSGDDSYRVQFKGGISEAFTNIMDSGEDKDDSINVQGTIGDDNILVRASDAGLGMIARLDTINNAGKTENVKERVNYWNNEWKGAEFASLETGAGKDHISVDSTQSVMEIDAGNDSDVIYVGQLFNSTRDNSVVANTLDAFENSVIKTKDGYLSAGATHSLTVKGGVDDDTLNVLHASAALSLYGNLGYDTFNIYSFVDDSNNAVVNDGKITTVGGSEKIGWVNKFPMTNQNELNIFGLPVASTYMLTDATVVAANLEVAYTSYTKLNLYGSHADDTYYLFGLPHTKHYLHFNGGSDHVYGYESSKIGEYDRMPTETTPSDIREGILDERAKKDQNMLKVLFVESDGKTVVNQPWLKISEGDCSYSMILSEAPKDSITIRVTIADLAADKLNCGAKPISLINEKGESVEYLDLTFTSKNYNDAASHQVHVAEINGLYFERDNIMCIHHDVIESDADVEISNGLLFTNQGALSVDYTNGFVDTQSYKVSDCSQKKIAGGYSYSMTIKLNEGYLELPAYSGYYNILCDGLDDVTVEKSVTGTELTLSWTTSKKMDADRTFTVNYVSAGWHLDSESSVLFKHFGDVPLSKVPNEDRIFVLSVNGEYYVLTNVRDEATEGFFYKTNGNRIYICSNTTGEEVSVTGYIYIPTEKQALTRSHFEQHDASYSETVPRDLATSSDFMDAISDSFAPTVTHPSPTMLPGESNVATTTARPAARPAYETAPSGNQETAVPTALVLEAGMPDSIAVAAGETVCLKVRASSAPASSMFLMVNSEDGKQLPALTWSWDDSSKKRVTLEEDEDLTYQVDLTGAANTDDFIYVYLHAAKACQFVASAFAG